MSGKIDCGGGVHIRKDRLLRDLHARKDILLRG